MHLSSGDLLQLLTLTLSEVAVYQRTAGQLQLTAVVDRVELKISSSCYSSFINTFKIRYHSIGVPT